MESPADRVEPRLGVALTLAAVAVITRLVWTLAVHPPADHIYSDMAYYVARAERLVEHGMESGRRELAWQAWGTHVLLAGTMRLGGGSWASLAGVLWALCSAATATMVYPLACRLLRTHAAAVAVAAVALAWWPSITNAGYFLSEAPFAAATLGASCSSLRLLDARHDPDGRRLGVALAAGVLWGLALALRPQVGVSLLLLTIGWLAMGRARPRVTVVAAVAMVLPVVLVAGISVERFHRHTGRWAGVAEAAELNRTIGRCHQLITLARPTPEIRAQAARDGVKARTRRVVAPAIRALYDLPPDHPFHESGEAIGRKLVFEGYIGEPSIHRELRQQCWAKTGWSGQARRAVAHTLTAWLWSAQWPEKGGKEPIWTRRTSQAFRLLSAGLLLGPGLLGLGMLLARARREISATLLSAHLLGFLVISLIFFASVRTRLPYDPYWLIAAAVALEWGVLRLMPGQRLRRKSPSNDGVP